MKDRPSRSVNRPASTSMRNGSAARSSRNGDSDDDGGVYINTATMHTQPTHTQSPDAITFRHKLMKRPRSPHAAVAAASARNSALPPIRANANAHASNASPRSASLNGDSSGVQPAARLPVQERQMRSFLQNFLADDTGQFKRVLDLQQHALDTGLAVTDATVQEVVNAIPTLRGLRLTGCAHVTDAGVWAIARQCAQLDTIYLARCPRVTELGLRLLVHRCQLVAVDLSDCPQVTDSLLQTLAAGCWMLQTFVIQRCAHVTDAGLVKIAQCCKDLRHLDVSECEHVGEYGDKALVALGQHCARLAVLDLFGCRHVHDAGIRAVARGCPLLTTLRLTGCRSVSSVAVRALASQCRALESLSLAGCVQTTNSDLAALATQCASLQALDISGSPNIDAVGVRALARSCSSLTSLSLADCERVSDTALQALAQSGNRTLATLSLANCARVTERGVDALAAACPNLVTLDLTGCAHIGRRFLQQLIHRLEFVEWATAFFGFQPLPNAAELCRARDRRQLEARSAVRIQAVIRGCRARGGLYEAKLRYVERRVLPKIQARVRGFLVRQQLQRERQYEREDRAARIIAREYRNLQLRRLLARAKRLRAIRNSEDAAARVFQRLFRGHRARQRVERLHDAQRRERQFQARVHAMRELAAVKLQRAYRGHTGRSEAAVRAAAREAQRRRQDREQRAAAYLQRVYRGHRGRLQRAQRLAELLHQQRRHTGAMQMQKVFRGHRGRRNALLLRDEAAQLRVLNAALTIQRYWRGLRQKHLAAVLLGLIKLRAREHSAAHTIQSAYRMHASRGFAKALRLTLLAQRARVAAATTIQRVLRGHRGRAEYEVQRELRKLEAQARPLFAKQTRLAALVVDQREQVAALERKVRGDELDERALTLELDKTMQIKTKYHDSSRITGTPQRYLTQYLQVQLADQLRAQRLTIALDNRSLEALTTALSGTEKQLRVAQRALEPLTDGVVAKTKANRTKRLQETVRRQRRAAVAIQRTFRGFRVRCAMREGGNCWLQLWTAGDVALSEPPRTYYYNALTGVTRWSRPLAMDIFGDTFAEPIGGSSQVDMSSATATSAGTSSRSSGGAWYEAFDDAVQATYYFHSGTREYQWDRPETLGNAFFTASESSRRRRAWLDEQSPGISSSSGTDGDNAEMQEALEALLDQTVVRGPLLGAWETRVDPVSEHFVFYNPRTRAVRTSLSPRSVHASLGDTAMQSRRTARSIHSARSGTASDSARRRPLHWQYRYGYEYDSSGQLVASAQPRPVWTQHVDAESGAAHYCNALTDETRWEKPVDVDATYEQFVHQRSASREWFAASMTQSGESGRESARTVTARSVKTRALGPKWVELRDAETQHTYYYNEITGESRWSLSPRSARDASDRDDQISLALFAQVQQLRTSPVAYTARADHMAWLEAAMDASDWPKVDGLVQQILLREQSELAAERKTRHHNDTSALVVSGAAGVTAVDGATASGQLSATHKTSSNSSSVLNNPHAVASTPTGSALSSEHGADDSTASSNGTRDNQEDAASAWTPYVDEVGNTFYYNEQTGETSWSVPSNSESSLPTVAGSAGDDDATSEWQTAYDGDGNAYFYNSATGETAWTAPGN